MRRADRVFETVIKLCGKQLRERGRVSGVTALEIARDLNLYRSNVSADLNKLVRSGKLEKVKGKPTLYKPVGNSQAEPAVNSGSPEEAFQNQMERPTVFDSIIGAHSSLKTAIQQAKAAVLYPPDGLHTLIIGDTGTGKSMFAEIMYTYAKDRGGLKSNAPFVAFNCADYANNPQLLVSQLFGAKKGTYTGLDQDKIGLVERADNGVLFLDEVHRLPPEGQEMLFYLLDKGMYRRLGEAEAYRKAKVFIICATTENIQSTLQKTFLRRIPVIIRLPALKDWSPGDRLELVKYFFRCEANLLKAPITVEANSIKLLLYYDCPGNIGQLRQDIKLTCARAFLEYMPGKDKSLRIESHCLPEAVKEGFVRNKGYRDPKDIGLDDGNMVFLPDGSDQKYTAGSEGVLNIYEALEQRVKALKSKGMSDRDIRMVISLEMDTYIKRYISYAARFDRDNATQLYKIVDKRLVDIVRLFLSYASKRLNRTFSNKILFGLSIHMSIAIDRLKSGKMISNPHLEETKRLYAAEFDASKVLLETIDREFGMRLPEDELGFVTMFLVIEDYARTLDKARVGVVVVMHGDSTATSMAGVVNKLLQEECVVPYDMPLEQPPEVALENLTDLVVRANEGRGVVMLVDMGSLALFGDIIFNKTGIPIKTIDMASTPMVLEAARKSQMLSSLEDIYDSVINFSTYIGKAYLKSEDFDRAIKENVIVTACITGRGTALKLKEIVEGYLLKLGADVDVIPVEITSMKDYEYKIQTMKREKNVLAVVSTFKYDDASVMYIPATDILAKDGLDLLRQAVENDENLQFLEQMKRSMQGKIGIDVDKFMHNFTFFYHKLRAQGIVLTPDTLAGLVLHMACALEKILRGNYEGNAGEADAARFLKLYDNQYSLIKGALSEMEDSFGITFPPSEYVNAIRLIHFI
ncbi:MAG: sigma 54-interacting transcriptional regulator [Tepidanaerobacteraceae bacterium]